MNHELIGITVSAERILISFYGDDFTGTTATADALTQSGLPTVIFTEPPSPSYLERNFPRVRAVGISGTARTLPAKALPQVLAPIFLSLKAYQSPIVLSKHTRINTSENVGDDRGPILVISGSCATITGEQILWAKNNGFHDFPISPQNLLDSARRYSDREHIITPAINTLAEGKSVILHTAIGPTDERIAAMNRTIEKLSLTKSEANDILGGELGAIAYEILSGSAVKRVVISGGDTAGRIQKMLQIEALQISKSIGIAAALFCVLERRNSNAGRG